TCLLLFPLAELTVAAFPATSFSLKRLPFTCSLAFYAFLSSLFPFCLVFLISSRKVRNFTPTLPRLRDICFILFVDSQHCGHLKWDWATPASNPPAPLFPS